MNPSQVLDHNQRGLCHELLLRHIEKVKASCILVTHDITEAMYLSDKIIVLASKDGAAAETSLYIDRNPLKGLQQQYFGASDARSLYESTLKAYSGR